MKIRQGFVSNSSSTSFLCEVCGEVESGMDMSLDDAGMYECTNGHTFCVAHAIGNSVVGEDGEKILTERSLVLEEGDEYNIPAENCPCCSFKELSSFDLTKYLLWKTNMSKEAIAEEIRGRFANYKTFQDYLEGKHI